MAYVPIRITTLRKKACFQFDIYLKLPSKYLLYFRGGDEIDHDRILSLKKKKVRQLFISEEAEKQYQQHLDEALNAAVNSPDMAIEEKASIVESAASSAVEGMQDDPHSQANYNECKKAAKAIIEVVGQTPEVLRELLGKKEAPDSGEDNDLQEASLQNSIMVSTLSTTLANVCELKREQIHNIGIAALVHDLGMINVSEETQKLMFTDMKQWPPAKVDEYKKHPQFGAELLSDKPYANPEILELIYSHEENKSGSGFPKGLKDLTESQEILSLCCNFSYRVQYLKQDKKEAVKAIQTQEIGKYDLNLINKFKDLVKSQIL